MSKDFFAKLPKVASFKVTSKDVKDGGAFALSQYSGIFGIEGGKDISPQLSWSGAPEGTKSFAVTIYDLDAPTGAGFWHWVIANIPANVTELETGAGEADSIALPKGAFQLPNDARDARYIGAAPPAGHGQHTYVIVVYALDVEDIDIPADSTPTFLGFNMGGHTLARAVMTATAEL
ncbi:MULTISPECIES: YbhB/YbcL family Raf kinase inhibitor-like protein [unclassified Clostridium]|uniref:YbhB/YbcL family Raf kinase inhibitor-like protein n=1 Tax=unclassified Clostridium TaxID=2614128 RepID=UPI000297C24A|nr:MULTISPECIES: YbhB/YbcL family Raf kinase inhibitor-like protein [unclassified Clostridium]EKQ57728.1 MAG: Raf kinase inhibitor-like protein, YbhB/YbcL family [Clostridium sp. Maddingley MBC34-26]